VNFKRGACVVAGIRRAQSSEVGSNTGDAFT
jgi:hypothetical protein